MNQQKEDDIEFSTEMRQITGTMPAWMIRRGFVIMILIGGILLTCAVRIDFPDQLTFSAEWVPVPGTGMDPMTIRVFASPEELASLKPGQQVSLLLSRLTENDTRYEARLQLVQPADRTAPKVRAAAILTLDSIASSGNNADRCPSCGISGTAGIVSGTASIVLKRQNLLDRALGHIFH